MRFSILSRNICWQSILLIYCFIEQTKENSRKGRNFQRIVGNLTRGANV